MTVEPESERISFTVRGPMMTAGAGAWGGVGAERVRASQSELTGTVADPKVAIPLRDWLAQGRRLSVSVRFHLSPRRAAQSDLDNLLNAMFNTIVEAAGFARPPGKPIPQTKDALFWSVEAEKVQDAEEYTEVRIWVRQNPSRRR